jgi:hypothetical protein
MQRAETLDTGLHDGADHILAERKGVYAKYADENVIHGQNQKIRLSTRYGKK